MIAALAAAAIGMGPGERDYRLTVTAVRGAHVALRASVPHGWIVAFCTSRVCSAGHTVVHIPTSGRAIVTLHLYRVNEHAVHAEEVSIAEDGRPALTLHVFLASFHR